MENKVLKRSTLFSVIKLARVMGLKSRILNEEEMDLVMEMAEDSLALDDMRKSLDEMIGVKKAVLISSEGWAKHYEETEDWDRLKPLCMQMVRLRNDIAKLEAILRG